MVSGLAALFLFSICIICNFVRANAFCGTPPLLALPKARPLLSANSPRRSYKARTNGHSILKMQFGDMFNKLRDKALLNIVSVKEKAGAKKDLQECPFCEGTGDLFCASCNGAGKDLALGGKCYVCNGKDTDGKWLGKKGKAGAVFDPLTPQYEPYILELDEAKPYMWCQCGVSTKQPFCDGTSHRAYGIKPVPFKTEGEAGKKSKVNLCGCKYTNTPPYCDGTHVALAAKAKADGVDKT